MLPSSRHEQRAALAGAPLARRLLIVSWGVTNAIRLNIVSIVSHILTAFHRARAGGQHQPGQRHWLPTQP